MRTFIPFTLLLLPLVALAAADPAPAPSDPVGSLIHDLSSDSYRTREQATQRLVDLGDAVLPRLQQLLPLTVDAETRSRVQSAIDQILESAAAGPSLITIDVHDADAKTVFAELSRQAHAEVRVAPELLASLPPVTFHCQREPFWPALKRLCAPLNLAPDSLTSMGMIVRRMPQQQDGDDHVLNLVRAGEAWQRTPTTFSGPFLISVQRVTRTGVVVPSTGQHVHNLMIECIVQAEPKLTVVGRNPTARVTLPDPAANPAPGAGRAFIRPPFASRIYYNPTAASAWPLVIPVSIAPDVTDKLPQLKAVSSAKVLVRSHTWELPDIAHAAPRSWQAGGRTFTVASLTRQGDRVELLATATRTTATPGGIQSAAEDMAVFNSLELLDPQGRPLTARGRSPRPSSDPTALAYTVIFDATPAGAPVLPADAPLRLRWQLPLETKDVDLAINLTDVPLP